MKTNSLIASVSAVFLSLVCAHAQEQLNEEYESGEVVNELWKLTVDVPDGKLVLTTVTVTEDASASDGKNKSVKRFNRVVYTPLNSYSELVQHKGEWNELKGSEDAAKYSSMVLGFGQVIEIQSLVRTGGGNGELKMDQPDPGGTFSSRVRFNFAKSLDDQAGHIEVRFRMTSLPVSYFEDVLKGTGIIFPKLGDDAWALTLPPEFEQLNSDDHVSEFKAMK